MQQRIAAVAHLLVRGAAIFLGVFTLLGLAGELRGRTSDVNLWLVDIRDVPSVARIALLGAFSGLLLVWGARELPGARWRRAVAIACGAFSAFAVRDCFRFVAAVEGGLARPEVPIPLSLVIAVALVGLAFVALREPVVAEPGSRGMRPAVVLAAAAWAVVFPLAQMLFFGTTDYRRPADAAVIFGARVYANGRPSPLLADRISTGVELYRAGLAPVLVMSGGDGADGFNEALVMRDEAIAAGVDPAVIVVDPVGVTTEATVADTMTLLAARNVYPPTARRRLLAVSQAYHLPRVQLAFAAAGIDVLTVPAVDAEPIGEMPVLVVREIPAFWTYYLRDCLF